MIEIILIYLISNNLSLKISTEFSGMELVEVLPYAKPDGIINIIDPFSSIRGTPSSHPELLHLI